MPSDLEPDEFLKDDAAARFLRQKRGTLAAWRATGRGPAYDRPLPPERHSRLAGGSASPATRFRAGRLNGIPVLVRAPSLWARSTFLRRVPSLIPDSRSEGAAVQQKDLAKMTRKVVHPELPKTETSETEEAKQEFDTANYFKEAMALRKPLEPIIKKVAVIADVRIGRPHPDTWFQCNPDPQAALESYVVRDKEKNY